MQQPGPAECSGEEGGSGEEEREGRECGATGERAAELHVLAAGTGDGGRGSGEHSLCQGSNGGLPTECKVSELYIQRVLLLQLVVE